MKATDVRLARPITELRGSYDVIVIGSGYGGAVAAARLARAGRSVALLERGREVPTGRFPSRFPDLRSEMRVTGERVDMGSETGLFDVRVGADMHVLVACGLGGGSLVNAGVSLEPDPRVFADPRWPREIADDGLLAEGYARARHWLRPARHEDGRRLTKFEALREAGAALGTGPVLAPVAVSFGEGESAGGVEQPACTLCGDCCMGCNVGAKNTLALTYLPDAVRHGAEIFTEVKVTRLSRGQRARWAVEARPIGAPRPLAIEADIVIVAAGTLGSTEILLRSRERGLALTDRLGHGFSANGDIIAFGYGARTPVGAVGVGHPKRYEAEIGACVTGQIELHDPHDLEQSATIQEGAMPSAIAPVLPVLFLPNGRLLGALQSLVSGVYKGPFQGLQTFFAVSHDSASGELRLVDGRLEVIWPGARDEPVQARLDRILGALTRGVGADYVKNPLAGTLMGRQPATAHPLGGCGMGVSGGLGVVDHKCRVFDAAAGGDDTAVHPGLYVIDGSVVPRSLGVNPLLTITALAERAMMHMGRDLGLTLDDRPVREAARAGA